MDREVLPLLLASERFFEAGETEALDRLRMQKGVFLLEQRGPVSWKNAYEFSPYNWGPFSRDLAQDLGTMTEDGTMMVLRYEGFRFDEYRATTVGESIVDDFAKELEDNEYEFVKKVRAFVTRTSFTQLLRDIYSEYPEFAIRSRFKG